jgi:hypothetical protein
MRRRITITAASMIVIMSLAVGTHAEVKAVQMKIAGYLCGN